MSSVELISLIGVLAALVGLSFFVLKGVNNYLMAFAAAIVIAVTSGMDIYSTLLTVYMPGLAGYIAQWFIVFYGGALFGKLMNDCGAAHTVAQGLIKVCGKKYAPLAPIIACFIMGYGGVTTFVVGFTVVPIAVQIHRDANLPRRFIPAAIFFGPAIAMVMPGSPQIANIMCANACETNYMGGGFAAWLGVLGFGLILGCAVYMWMLNRAVAKGETFAARPGDLDIADDDASTRPGFLTSILPLIITVIAINIPNGEGGLLIPTEFALLLGCVTIIALNYKFFNKNEIVPSLGEGFKTSIIVIGNTAAIVGIGAVVKATPMFQPLVDTLTSVGGSPYLAGAGSIALLAGVLGSASGATSMVAPILAPAFIAQGANPGMLARCMTVASSTLDSLPHSGAVNSTIYAMCNETYESSYKPIFVMTVICTTLMTLACVVLGMIFY